MAIGFTGSVLFFLFYGASGDVFPLYRMLVIGH